MATTTTESTQNLRILCCTANMGNAQPTSLTAWIPKNGAVGKMMMMTQQQVVVEPSSSADKEQQQATTLAEHESEQYDIIVVGMQEATWKPKRKENNRGEAPIDEVDEEDEDLEDTLREDDLELQQLVDEATISEDNNSNNQTNSTSSLAGLKEQLRKSPELVKQTPELMKKTSSKMMEEFKKFAENEDSVYLRTMLLQDTVGPSYKLLKEFQRGQMRLYILVKESLVPEITNLDLKAENTGIAGVYYNKGGIVCTFEIRQTRLAFLTAHLAAHEGNAYYNARNDNIREILRGTKSLGPKHLNGYDVATSAHHMFLMGDLNYRIRMPNSSTMEKQEQVKAALKLVAAGDFETLYSYDELSAGIHNKDVLCQFQTLPCHFHPTFKMLRQEGFQYKEQRVPSYTDRILFTSAEGLQSRLMPLIYEPCPGFSTSDHKPIRGAFSIQTNNVATAPKSLAGPVRITFSNLKCSNLPVMDVDGSSDPYVKFVWDPIDLVKDDRDPSQRNKTSSGQVKWPITEYKQKNLNPSWNESVRLCIPNVNTEQLNGAMLYVTLMDYDATSQDDTMSILTLNLQEMASFQNEEEVEKVVQIDRPLLKYGNELGRIQCTIHVQRGGKQHTHRGRKKKGLFSGLKKLLVRK